MVDKLEASVGEQCASILEEAIAAGYPLPASKHDQCDHGKFGWEDCIACYDERLAEAAEQMRSLATPANGEQVERADADVLNLRAARAAGNIPTPTEDARERVKVLEEAAQVAERDVDWTRFAKNRVEQWEDGPDALRDYRLGINVGSVIAAQIRALGNKETDRHG